MKWLPVFWSRAEKGGCPDNGCVPPLCLNGLPLSYLTFLAAAFGASKVLKVLDNLGRVQPQVVLVPPYYGKEIFGRGDLHNVAMTCTSMSCASMTCASMTYASLGHLHCVVCAEIRKKMLFFLSGPIQVLSAGVDGIISTGPEFAPSAFFLWWDMVTLVLADLVSCW